MRIIFILALIISGGYCSQVEAQQCEDIFTNGISVNHDSGTAELQWHSRIRNGGSIIDAPSLNDGSSRAACSGSYCVASGSAAASSAPTFLTGSSTNGAINVGYNSDVSYPSGEYSSVFIDTRGELSMTTVDSVTYMSNVTINYQAKWRLAPGDYWINGNLYLDTQAEIEPIGTGTVRIFVNGSVRLRDYFKNTDFDPENFLLYSTGAITTDTQVRLSGFLYSASGTAFIGYQSVIAGALSGYNVVLDDQVRIDYEGSVLSDADFSPFCPGFVPAPVPIVLYHLDERSWSSSSGDVEDSSGNGLHGQAVNLNGLPTTDDTTPVNGSDPGTCGYGIFNGTNDGYIEIPDSGTGSLLDFSDNFSVSVWIYPLSYANGDLATIVSKDTNYEFHLNGSGQVNWWWGGGNEEITTSSSVNLNSWNHIAITYESGQQKIYLNGAEAGTSSSTATLTQNNDSLFIGTDLDYHDRRFNGYIDEVNIFDATLSADQVNEVMNQVHTCPIALLNHYDVETSGAGVTCQAELVTIIAHDDTHGAVDADSYTIEIRATSATPGWSANDVTWSLEAGGGSGTFSILSPGVAQYQFGTESAVALRLANTSEALIDIDVIDGLGNTDTDGDADEDDAIQFSDTGFLFYEDADGNSVGDGPIISSLVAGGISSNSIIRAVKTNEDGACVARVQGAQNVELAYECVNPSSCQLDKDLAVNGTAIEENNAGTVSVYQPVSMTFDASGAAPFQFEYFDVGKIRLHARLSLPSAGVEPAVTLRGSSDDSTVFPADIVITSIQAPDFSPNPGTTTGGGGFVLAGSPFRVTVESRNTDGRITPNFGLETPAETIQLNASALVMPVGGSLPALTSASAFSATATAGKFLNTSVGWPEAGTIDMYASTDDNYLDATKVTGSDSGNVGRFYPQHYTLNGVSLIEGCPVGGFTYMSDVLFNYRPLQFNFEVAAVAGTTTLTNYDQALGYPVGSLNVVAENNNNGINLTSRAVLNSAAFNAGVYQLSGGAGGLSRSASSGAETPDGPFEFVQFGLQASGGVDNLDFENASLTINPSQSNNCTVDGDCNAAALASPIEMRFGRLSGANVHGPESAPLDVPLNIQYWNGFEFVTNSDDHFCTNIALSEVLFDGNAINVDSNRTVDVASGSSTGSFTNFNPTSLFYFSNGESGLQFSAPDAGNTGSFYVDVDLTNYPFLRGDWNGNGNYADDAALPSIEVNFGRYRGHDRIIHWREVLN